MGRNARLKRERRTARKPRPVRGKLDTTNHDEWVLVMSNVPTDRPAVVLTTLLGSLRKVMLQAVKASSCICSTKLLLGLARAMGLKAEPQSVTGEVFNQVMASWLEDRAWRQWTREEQIGLVKRGGQLLVVGYSADAEGTPDDRWNGHLVAVVEDRLLIDLSFDQFDRPDKGIPVAGPLVVPWEARGACMKRDDGVAMRFYPREEDDGALGYTASADWARRYKIVLNGKESWA